MNHNLSRILMYVSIFVAIIPFSIGTAKDIGWLTVLGLVILAGGYIQACIFARCPHCRKSLMKKFLGQEYCPWCGERLD